MDEAALREGLRQAGYLADEALVTTVWLAQSLDRPLLLEGDAGVGKTALAQALATAGARRLIRLQCVEGLDLNQAAYEWNYGRQLLAIRLQEASVQGASEAQLFSAEYLLERPLLAALTSEQPAVLLIDEIDRADEAFEAFLLELLADWALTIPELGTVRARHVPWVLLTSNGTRELSDALRRRCLYHYVDYPTVEREAAIVRARLPQAEPALIDQAVALVHRLRREDLKKTPGIAETLDWVHALHRLGLRALPDEPETLLRTLACLLKTREDRFQIDADTLRRLSEARQGNGQGGVVASRA